MVDRAVECWGGLDILVNNAGEYQQPVFPDAPTAHWLRTLDINLRTVMLSIHHALPALEAGGGAVINLASSTGLGLSPHPGPEYATAKAGVIRLTACLAPLADRGVRVNCLCPHTVATEAVLETIASLRAGGPARFRLDLACRADRPRRARRAGHRTDPRRETRRPCDGGAGRSAGEAAAGRRGLVGRRPARSRPYDADSMGNVLLTTADGRRFLVAQLMDSLGGGLSSVVLPWLVLDAGGSGAEAGAAYLVGTIPYVLLGLPAGDVGDRHSRRRVMVGGATGAACRGVDRAAGRAVRAPIASDLPLMVIYAAGLGVTAGRVFVDAAAFGAIARLVGRGQLRRGPGGALVRLVDGAADRARAGRSADRTCRCGQCTVGAGGGLRGGDRPLVLDAGRPGAGRREPRRPGRSFGAG